jgi:hypothetical protein
MTRWRVDFYSEFIPEFRALPVAVRDEIGVLIGLLEIDGPQLRRPRSDTLSGSKHANMKELRFDADGGVWRVAYAFDPVREAVLLVAGDKSRVSQKRFYKTLIAKADARFDKHLMTLKPKGN